MLREGVAAKVITSAPFVPRLGSRELTQIDPETRRFGPWRAPSLALRCSNSRPVILVPVQMLYRAFAQDEKFVTAYPKNRQAATYATHGSSHRHR